VLPLVLIEPTGSRIKSPEQAISVSTPEISIEPVETPSVKSIFLLTCKVVASGGVSRDWRSEPTCAILGHKVV
jgi:hypothetical protein